MNTQLAIEAAVSEAECEKENRPNGFVTLFWPADRPLPPWTGTEAGKVVTP